MTHRASAPDSTSGTVTSVGVSGSDGIDVANSPVTGSGTIALSLGAITPDSVTFGAGTALSAYVVGTYTGTATGMTTAPTGTFKYTLIGNAVILDMPAITGTSNATTFTITGAPVAIRPTTAKEIIVRISDNGGAQTISLGTMGTNGTLTLYTNAAGGAFTNTGTKTIETLSSSYTLA